MKLWIGAETQADIIEQFRLTRSQMEQIINAAITKKEYDIELEDWDLIVILRDDLNFNEVIKYSKARKTMDFRLQLDVHKFSSGDEETRSKMLFELIMRSLKVLTVKLGNTPGILQLMADVEEVGVNNGWREVKTAS